MTHRSALTELAGFVARSPLAGPDEARRERAIGALAARLAPRQRRTVGELLGAVLALSARTRRVILPRTGIELEVYAPGGRRAVELILPG